MMRKIYMVAVVALAGFTGLHAQQLPAVEPRIAGLEGNAEYMSLLQEDAQLQLRADSIVNATEQARRQLRADPQNRQQYADEILALENRIFEVRNIQGKVVGRINAIEQEWVLANLDQTTSATQQPDRPVFSTLPDSLQKRNLVYNSYFQEQLHAADYAALLQAQTLEPVAAEYVKRFFANYATLAQCASDYAAAQTEEEASPFYDAYLYAQQTARTLSDSLSAVWNRIFDNKSYAYDYLMDKADRGDIRAHAADRLTEATQQVAAMKEQTASEAIDDYFLRKKVLTRYETTIAGVLGMTQARDSLNGVMQRLDSVDFRRPPIDAAERYFIDYDSITFSSTPSYTTQNPIPACKIYEHGTIYRILVGTFATKRAVSTFRGARPLCYRIDEDKKWAYYAGGFATQQEAEAAQQQLKKRGFTRPEIVVWNDGVYTNVSRDAQAAPTGYRIEITTADPLTDAAKSALATAAPEADVARAGDNLFVVGVFAGEESADRVADALRAAEPTLDVKVAPIAQNSTAD